MNNTKFVLDQPAIKIVSKGWGFEKWIVNTDKYCGKLLYFIKGKKCSLHYHKIKDETFYVHSGKIRIYYVDDLDKIKQYIASNPNDLRMSNILNQTILGRGDNFYIPSGRIHQMLAIEDTELYEFSTTHIESDSYRIIKGD